MLNLYTSPEFTGHLLIYTSDRHSPVSPVEGAFLINTIFLVIQKCIYETLQDCHNCNMEGFSCES